MLGDDLIKQACLQQRPENLLAPSPGGNSPREAATQLHTVPRRQEIQHASELPTTVPGCRPPPAHVGTASIFYGPTVLSGRMRNYDLKNYRASWN